MRIASTFMLELNYKRIKWFVNNAIRIFEKFSNHVLFSMLTSRPHIRSTPNIASESMKEQIINIAKGSFELLATLLEPGGDLGHFEDAGGSLC